MARTRRQTSDRWIEFFGARVGRSVESVSAETGWKLQTVRTNANRFGFSVAGDRIGRAKKSAPERLVLRMEREAAVRARWSELLRREVLEGGKTPNRLARELGCSSSTTRRWMMVLGLRRPEVSPQRRTLSTWERILEQAALHGETANQVAARTGVRAQRVRERATGLGYRCLDESGRAIPIRRVRGFREEVAELVGVAAHRTDAEILSQLRLLLAGGSR